MVVLLAVLWNSKFQEVKWRLLKILAMSRVSNYIIPVLRDVQAGPVTRYVIFYIVSGKMDFENKATLF